MERVEDVFVRGPLEEGLRRGARGPVRQPVIARASSVLILSMLKTRFASCWRINASQKPGQTAES